MFQSKDGLCHLYESDWLVKDGDGAWSRIYNDMFVNYEKFPEDQNEEIARLKEELYQAKRQLNSWGTLDY